MENLLSVYIITFNRADYLKDSIESVLRQTFTDFQLYILDNCSTDHTEEVVKGYDDSRIHYIKHAQNIGGVDNINYAFSHNTSKYFVVFHDDDIMEENMLSDEVTFMEDHPEVSIVSGNAILCDETMKVQRIANKFSSQYITYSGNALIKHYLAGDQPSIFPSIMYRNAFIKKYNIHLIAEAGPSSDVLMQFEIERYGGTIVVLNEVVIRYRQHTGQDSVNSVDVMMDKLFSYLQNNQFYSEILKGNKCLVDYFVTIQYYRLARSLLKRRLSEEKAKKTAVGYRKICINRFSPGSVLWAAFFCVYKIAPNEWCRLYAKLRQVKNKKDKL